MVKHAQIVRRQIANLSVFDDFVKLVLKGLIRTWLNLKTMFEGKRSVFKNKWDGIDFGAMLFEVQAQIFVELINL